MKERAEFVKAVELRVWRTVTPELCQAFRVRVPCKARYKNVAHVVDVLSPSANFVEDSKSVICHQRTPVADLVQTALQLRVHPTITS